MLRRTLTLLALLFAPLLAPLPGARAQTSSGPANPLPLDWPAGITDYASGDGLITSPSGRDWYAFSAKTAGFVELGLEGNSSFTLKDPLLCLFDKSGALLLEQHGDDLVWYLDKPGLYFPVVGTGGGGGSEGGHYNIVVLGGDHTQRGFGAGARITSAAVPEPGTLLLLAGAALTLPLMRVLWRRGGRMC